MKIKQGGLTYIAKKLGIGKSKAHYLIHVKNDVRAWEAYKEYITQGIESEAVVNSIAVEINELLKTNKL
jgi:hypothetical protein